jgi:hypothetical protein
MKMTAATKIESTVASAQTVNNPTRYTKMSRNRRNLLKTNNRVHFYSIQNAPPQQLDKAREARTGSDFETNLRSPRGRAR